MRFLVPILSSLLLTLTACVTGGSDKLVQSSEKDVSLILVPRSDPGTSLAQDANTLVVDEKGEPTAADRDVWDACGYKGSENRVAFAPMLVGLGVDMLLNAISNELAAEIAKYSAGFSAKVTDAFYVDGDTRPKWSCLRFIRYGKDSSSGNKTVVFDLVALLQTTNDYLQIVPLRLYYKDAKAASDSGKISLAVTLSAETVWRQGNQGMSAQILNNAPLFSVSCDLSNGPAVWYSKSSAGGKCSSHAQGSISATGANKNTFTGIRAPLPAYSIAPSGVTMTGPGSISITATAAEVGAPPALLCALASAFKSQKSSIQTALTTAIDEKLGLQSSSSSGKSASGNGSNGANGGAGNGSGSASGGDKTGSTSSTGSTACKS